jgi:hypothetical protein
LYDLPPGWSKIATAKPSNFATHGLEMLASKRRGAPELPPAAVRLGPEPMADLPQEGRHPM